MSEYKTASTKQLIRLRNEARTDAAMYPVGDISTPGTEANRLIEFAQNCYMELYWRRYDDKDAAQTVAPNDVWLMWYHANR